jgi:hypothetical protein
MQSADPHGSSDQALIVLRVRALTANRRKRNIVSMTRKRADVAIIMKSMLNRRNLLKSSALLVPALVAPQLCPAQAIRGFSPLDFGASGDGESDDSAALQRAADAARSSGGTLWIPEGHVFGIRRNILIRNGVRSVAGGGTIRVLPSASSGCAIVGAGRASGQQQNLADCMFQDFTFDANHMHSLGLYFQNAQRCGALNVRVVNGTNLGTGILFKSFAAGGEPGNGNYARGCVIERDEVRQQRGSVGIAFGSEVSFGSSSNLLEYWKKNDQVPVPRFAERNGAVTDCRVSGGYYGLSMGGAENITVQRFTSENNIRCISMQSGSNHNCLSDLQLRNSVSSAILIGYGSCDNRISDALAETSRANGEALFQSIVGSKRNVFSRCRTNVVAGAPQYHFYCAIESDDCQFVDCQADGRALLAYAAIESAWSTRVNNHAHHGRWFGPQLNGFAHHGMGGVVIRDLHVDAASSVPGIFIAQIADDRAVYPLTDIQVSPQSISGAGYSPPIERLTMTSPR